MSIWTRQNINELSILFLVSLAIKSLLIEAYYSTDFAVHQNWLTITSQKPIAEWYFDQNSKWTLDYPPLFAYFQFVLAKVSALFDPSIAKTINELRSTIYFQRLSVIASQIPFLLVLFKIFKKISFQMVVSYFFLGFIVLDNIHFQYNIIMQAIFLYSIYLMHKRRFLSAAFTYSCLLNFKHIYLYAMFAYLFYILKEYVLKENNFKQKIGRFVKVGALTIIPFVISFTPFIIFGGFNQIQQIVTRLFPFQRGLIHQYWAPNFWAIYHFSDKILSLIYSKVLRFQPLTMGSNLNNSELNSLKILPQISPLQTTIIILCLTLPVILIFLRKNIKFYQLVFLCGYLFFMFGFHVHQKAITPYVHLLFVFSAIQSSKNHRRIKKSQSSFESQISENAQNSQTSYKLLNAAIFVNLLNLLPLLIGSNQKLLRIVLLIFWVIIWAFKFQIKSKIEYICIFFGCSIFYYHEIIHPLVKNPRLQFLPLMLNSVFSAVFNLIWLIFSYFSILKGRETRQIMDGL